MNTVTRRVMSIVLPFARGTVSNRLIGGIRIRTPKPYNSDDYYIVSVDDDEAVFLKEDARRTVHVVDRDMGCCDRETYGQSIQAILFRSCASMLKGTATVLLGRTRTGIICTALCSMIVRGA